MSNYPKELWRTHIREKLLIARSFNTVVEKYVQNREAVRLKSLFGIRIVEIGNNFISVKPVSFIQALKTKSLGVVTKINLGERVTVGYYSVELKDIDGNRAKVRVANNYKVWEEKMLDHIQPQYGHITVKKMINWSRLHKEDLDGLRPMCQNIYEYEAVAIYKIPEQNYEIMSSGWFSPNHACSSIYVPFHICNTDIYDPYETGEAAELCLNLLKEFGHGVLDTNFTKVEEVFLNEINDAEQISIEQMENDLSISDFLTIIDTGMQKQAFLTEEIWMEAIRVPNPYKKKAIMDTIAKLWDTDYANTLDRMKNALLSLEEFYGVNIIKEKIVEIVLDICKSRIDAANTLEKETQIAEEEYEEANKLIKQGKYNPGFDNLQKAFTRSDMLIKGQTFKNLDIVEAEKNKEDDPFLYVLIFVLIFAILALILRLRLNSQ
jgi:hypothetical protein